MDLLEKLKDGAFWKRNLIRVGKFVGFYLIVFIALATFLRFYTHHGHTNSQNRYLDAQYLFTLPNQSENYGFIRKTER